MSTTAWLVIYFAQSLFFCWLIWGGGATTLIGWTVHPLAPRWGAEGIRLWAGLWLAATTIWFLLGLVDHGLRWWY